MSETIDDQEKAARAEAVRQAIHSTEMEGGRVDDEQRAYLAEYARGELTAEQLHASGREQVARLLDDARGVSARRG